MQNRIYELKAYGPFNWYGKETNSLFCSPQIEQSGIYLWTVPINNQYVVYYTGETGVSFASRFLDHTKGYLDGVYRVYEPSEFLQAEKKLFWEGMWKKDLGPTSKRMHEFLNRYPELSKVIYDFLACFKIFLLPLNSDRRIRQRIEAAIANLFYNQLGRVGKFQETDIRYAVRNDNEEPVKIKIKCDFEIVGLEEEFMA